MTIVCEQEVFLIDKEIFIRLSPLQRKILTELTSQKLTLSELSERTGSSVYTIGKQLSILQMRTKCNTLLRKGISEPLVRKHKDMGVRTTYFVNPMVLNAREEISFE